MSKIRTAGQRIGNLVDVFIFNFRTILIKRAFKNLPNVYDGTYRGTITPKRR